MRKFWEKGKSIEDVHVPAAVEYDFTGVAVAAELLALAILEHGGQDALVVHSVRRCAEAGLIAQALVLAWAVGDVADGPVAGHLIEIEVFVHCFFVILFGFNVQIIS